MKLENRSTALVAAFVMSMAAPMAVNGADSATAPGTSAASGAANAGMPKAKEEAAVKPAKLTPTGRAALRVSRKAQMLPGPSLEVVGGPLAAAEEAYANRAYPAAEIPFALTLNAQSANNAIRGRGIGQGKNVPGQWTMIGPSHADYPAVLTFSGADYTTSGRITALAISPDCGQGKCRLWVAAAGGGVWRTDNALSGSGPSWTFLSGGFATNAIGALSYAGGVLYAGTGEPNASGDSEAGMGIYKSTDGGDTWTLLAGSSVFQGRSIGSVVVDPANASTIYVGVTRGVRGVSSVTGGATTTPPIAAAVGLYKSLDGGATFGLVWNGNASVRGVNHVELDPTNSNTVYAAAFQNGVWRSTNGGVSFTQIFAPIAPTLNTDRAEFSVAKLPNGNTRMYVGDGAQGTPPAGFFRHDNAAAAVLGSFIDLTTAQNRNYCTGQCWYDNFVHSPPGYPDIVYLGGSYLYPEYGLQSNSRAVLLSTDGGASFTDMSWDASSDTAPNGIHPDQHALVTRPGDPYTFFEGSDGGLMRSSGAFKDISYQCATRGLSAPDLALCTQLLSRVPSHLFSLNKGLSTLQFQSLSVNPFNSKNLMGGTQDNGTFESTGSAVVWPQLIYGDGGLSGFSSGNGALRFNTFTGQANDVNFQNGDPTKWVVATGPIVSSPEGAAFYPPVIADPSPASPQTIFQGSQSVWRTQAWGGSQAFLEANCPEFTTSAANPACGDFVRIGPAGATDLTVSSADYRGTTRAGGVLAALARTSTDTGTLWVASATGRIFISKNAGAPAASVTFTRLDALAANDPGRFVSGIYVDPANPNRAWISYSGYDFNTPAQPGHVFEVTYNPAGPSATWTNVTFDLGDLPATGVARDDVTGDLYASSDFGVYRLPSGGNSWLVAGVGLPQVEIAGLTIVPSARKLYAATHGRSAWGLTLP